ncbi:hypothetical protein BDY21DRAFT_408661 [Lineolata rhizophorae]|uniref:Uncharacterized protein n=1 Tax=Lineolata rhizophorae TaxID=578093 RepID=A0A6A6P6B7_9PEZI|nr:hypothetical protein BDY21DRAFT_408661 [Lineolata rhizophorae]
MPIGREGRSTGTFVTVRSAAAAHATGRAACSRTCQNWRGGRSAWEPFVGNGVLSRIRGTAFSNSTYGLQPSDGRGIVGRAGRVTGLSRAGRRGLGRSTTFGTLQRPPLDQAAAGQGGGRRLRRTTQLCGVRVSGAKMRSPSGADREGSVFWVVLQGGMQRRFVRGSIDEEFGGGRPHGLAGPTSDPT